MKKQVYLNGFYNKGLIIDNDNSTFYLTSKATADAVRDGNKYAVKIERIAEVVKQLKTRGFKGFKKA